MKGKSIFLVLMTILLAISACSSPKEFVYLQDMKEGVGYPYDVKHEAVIHYNDRLAITVSSKSPELAIPFNANLGVVEVSSNGTVSESSHLQSNGYRVDQNGDINFPILGKLHIEGLRVSEVTEMIRNMIIEGKYIKDPIVSLEFLNFRFSVLGASGSATYTVEDGRINLLEAIAKAGDIASNGRVNKVAVIREENGEHKMYMHDLRSTEIFKSPCFYLQQNDIIYVEPSTRKDNEEKGFRIATTVLSFATAVSSILLLILRL
ncbi:MAG: polysaccharide biosynthesis/export family protein [Bacteroidales bacterium]|nr:polysaccharide biosynthesis/export family protein [Bacteroidales bacterium]